MWKSQVRSGKEPSPLPEKLVLKGSQLCIYKWKHKLYDGFIILNLDILSVLLEGVAGNKGNPFSAPMGCGSPTSRIKKHGLEHSLPWRSSLH